MNLKKYLLESAKYMLRCYPLIRRYVKEVEALFRMSREDLDKRNEQRFLEIFRRAYDKSPFYHRLYSEAGISKADITSLADIKKLPIITKEMVKAHAEEMLTVPRWRVRVACTSGTTGTPLKVYEDWKSIWRAQAYTYVTRKRSGFTYGQPLVSLRGNLEKKDLLLKIHASNTLFLSSYNINPDRIHFYHSNICKHQPVAIEGYPSSLYSLALMLRDAGLELHIPVAFTSSETLLDYQRLLIEKQLHTQIYDRYGMTERTIYLVETDNHNGYYEAPGFSINEYLEDGEICTSLINDSFPMIRYRSNDIIELFANDELLNPDAPIQHIEGRKEDYIVCKDGSKVMRLDWLLKSVDHVKMSQLVQERSGLLSVNIVPDTGFSDSDKNEIEHNLLHRLGENNIDYQINLITEENIQYSSRGKFKYVINLTNVKTGGVRIKRILGRLDDILICKDGSLVSRIDFIETGRHIKACQWIQKKSGELLIKIVPDSGFTLQDKLFVHTETEKRVGKGNMDITTSIVEMKDLSYTGRGKFKLIVNYANRGNKL